MGFMDDEDDDALEGEGETCSNCGGSGLLPDKHVACPVCGGAR